MMKQCLESLKLISKSERVYYWKIINVTDYSGYKCNTVN